MVTTAAVLEAERRISTLLQNTIPLRQPISLDGAEKVPLIDAMIAELTAIKTLLES